MDRGAWGLETLAVLAVWKQVQGLQVKTLSWRRRLCGPRRVGPGDAGGAGGLEAGSGLQVIPFPFPGAGDFVDRGAWGLETLAVLAVWKLAAPHALTLLRGNHESATCTAMYGFRAELAAKYGAVRACQRV